MAKKSKNKNKVQNDHGFLVIHGVGNQKEYETLRKYGGALRDKLLQYEGNHLEYGSDEEIKYGTKKSIKINLGEKSKYNNLYIRETHWAQDYSTSLKNKFLWVVLRIHLISILLFFDNRDKIIFNQEAGFWGFFRELGTFFRFFARFLIFVASMLAICLIGSLLARLPYILFKISLPYEFFGILILVLAVVLFFVYINGEYSLANDVRIAAGNEVKTKDILDKIENSIKKFPSSVKSVTIIAHSQGGYLAYKYLSSPNYRYKKKVKSFKGIGSGLGAINLMHNLEKGGNLISSWILFIIGFLSVINILLTIKNIFYFLFLVVNSCFALLGYYITKLEFPNRVFNAENLIYSIEYNIDLKNVLLFILSFISIAALYKSMKYRDIDNISFSTNWEEYSSVRDIVGRVNPILIQKNQIHYNEVGIPGNPLSVHTSYFEKFSTLPSVLVAEIHSEPDLKKANNLQSSLNRIALRRKNLYSVIIWLIISSYAYYNSSRNGNGDMPIKLYDSFLDILTLIIAVLVGYYASIYIICNKFNFKFGFSPVKNKFSSYISGTMHYEWQFSPFSTVYKFILGFPVFLYSASLFIFSTNNIKGDRWYIIDIILFFVSLIYLLASIAIISGHTLYGIKYIIYGVISLFFLPIIGLVYIHIALIYFIILCFITTYVYLCWKKNDRFTKSSLSMH